MSFTGPTEASEKLRLEDRKKGRKARQERISNMIVKLKKEGYTIIDIELTKIIFKVVGIESELVVFPYSDEIQIGTTFKRESENYWRIGRTREGKTFRVVKNFVNRRKQEV